MSEFNIEWAKQVLPENSVIFDIGCADMWDSIQFRNAFPKSKIYAFECADSWKNENIERAKYHDINYFHYAVSDADGTESFFPSKMLKNEPWPWSGSILEPDAPLLNQEWVWDTPVIVNSISLNTFCEKHKIIPKLIHIDAQGAEFKIFKNMKECYLPDIIWTEISSIQLYKTNITYNDFKKLMLQKEYKQIYEDKDDSLFVKQHLNSTYP